MLEKWDKRMVFEIVLIYLENKVDTCSPYHNLPVMLFQAMDVMIYPPPPFPIPLFLIF